ncbi:MAG: methylmalonyl-CoA epimerase [Spirochaetaceae bacterium]
MHARRVDHVGIAVEDLEAASKVYSELLGIERQGVEEVAEQKVRVAFFPLGESEIELLEPTTEDSPIAGFIAKRGPGIHHMAVRVDDLPAALERARKAGMRLIDEEPRAGAGGARIAFVHPASTGGVLLELCERT